jgi:DNA-3-methyladenine glycosylase II
MHDTHAIDHLRLDLQLGKLIQSYQLKPLRQPETIDIFSDLVGSIISQQLSVKAADAIEKRVLAALPPEGLTPTTILTADQETLRSCGLSYAKIKYIRSAADAVLSGLVNFDNLGSLPDEEVIQELVQISGVGRWTAEMLLIFSLERPDVFSVGDLGLRNAVARLYGLDREDRGAISLLAEAWSPYRSLASRYLWASLENTPNPSTASSR